MSVLSSSSSVFFSHFLPLCHLEHHPQTEPPPLEPLMVFLIFSFSPSPFRAILVVEPAHQPKLVRRPACSSSSHLATASLAPPFLSLTFAPCRRQQLQQLLRRRPLQRLARLRRLLSAGAAYRTQCAAAEEALVSALPLFARCTNATHVTEE